MAITLREVAKRAGVSRSAVSRTYTEGASVSTKTRQKVLQAATELGYSPNVLASSLTTGRTKLVGLISDNFRNPIFLQVFDRFTQRLQERGLRPLLINLSGATDPENSVRLLQQYSADAVIVASSTLPVSFAQCFHDAGMRVVHSFGRHTKAPKVHVVGIDNIAAGKLAAQTLVECGYRRIGMMGGPASATSTQDRLAGFLEVMREQPEIEVTTSFAPSYSFDAGRAEMTRLLSSRHAEAYFCGDDVLTIGALSAAQSLGLSVPDDLGLLGLNDMEIAGWENIALTTIHNPIEQIVDASIELVAELLDDADTTPKARLFDCYVVERNTLRRI
ncbi:LacI family transcriptional regulator [Rhodobacteraceae bacterium]|nr:LacI family transcriptional regulator [Paracoccaceae bacterium]